MPPSALTWLKQAWIVWMMGRYVTAEPLSGCVVPRWISVGVMPVSEAFGASAPAGAFTPWQPVAPLDQSALPPGGLNVLATVCTPAAGLPLVLAAPGLEAAAGEALARVALGAEAAVGLVAEACVAELAAGAPLFEGLLLLLLLLLLLQLTDSAIAALSPITSSVRRSGRVASIHPPLWRFNPHPAPPPGATTTSRSVAEFAPPPRSADGGEHWRNIPADSNVLHG